MTDRKLVARGVEFVEPPERQPWAARPLTCAIPTASSSRCLAARHDVVARHLAPARERDQERSTGFTSPSDGLRS
jgi:hypothetical protein